jgi:hypothetical protein
MKWCSIVELTHWIEHQKKTIFNLMPSKTKINNYYLGPILDVVFKKWFPLFKVLSPRTTTP